MFSLTFSGKQKEQSNEIVSAFIPVLSAVPKAAAQPKGNETIIAAMLHDFVL